MRMILIFQPDAAAITPSRIAESLEEGLGLVGLLTDGESKTDPEDFAGGEFSEGDFYIELPDLAEDEGEPTANYASMPRTERDETIAEIVKELVEQEDSLKPTFEGNGRDVIISFEDTPAGIEAGSVLAYAVASAVGAGVLLPAFDGYPMEQEFQA